jgi:hypothetical protein
VRCLVVKKTETSKANLWRSILSKHKYLYMVTLAWNAADRSQGNFCESVWAKNERRAIHATAKKMAKVSIFFGNLTRTERKDLARVIVAHTGPDAAEKLSTTLPLTLYELLAGQRVVMSPKANKAYAKIIATLRKRGVLTGG